MAGAPLRLTATLPAGPAQPPLLDDRQAMTRRPLLAAVAATGLLFALAAPVPTLQLDSPQIDAYPAGSPPSWHCWDG